jgi:hypothetical protein
MIHQTELVNFLCLIGTLILLFSYVLIALGPYRVKNCLNPFLGPFKVILLEGLIMSKIRNLFLQFINWFRMNKLMRRISNGEGLNHWGIFINSNYPVTGVFSFNEVRSWIWEEDSIDPEWEEHAESCKLCLDGFYCPDSDIWESTHLLIGDWVKDSEGLYDSDPSGDYAAIVNFDPHYTIQVIRSKYLKRGNPCSPCYPGQVEFSQEGDFIAFSLPYDLLQSELVKFNRLTYKWFIRSWLQDFYTFQIWNRYARIRFRFKQRFINSVW